MRPSKPLSLAGLPNSHWGIPVLLGPKVRSVFITHLNSDYQWHKGNALYISGRVPDYSPALTHFVSKYPATGWGAYCHYNPPPPPPLSASITTYYVTLCIMHRFRAHRFAHKLNRCLLCSQSVFNLGSVYTLNISIETHLPDGCQKSVILPYVRHVYVAFRYRNIP